MLSSSRSSWNFVSIVISASSSPYSSSRTRSIPEISASTAPSSARTGAVVSVLISVLLLVFGRPGPDVRPSGESRRVADLAAPDQMVAAADANGQPVGFGADHLELLRRAAKSGAQQLGHGFFRRPESREPQRLAPPR